MTRFLLRMSLPILVFAGGIACLFYGFGTHAAAVTEEQQIEVSLAPPLPPGMPGMPGDPFGGPGAGAPFAAPPPFLSKVTQTVVVSADESEAKLIREVSIGGVTLLASGLLRRTYSGEPPSLCPT